MPSATPRYVPARMTWLTALVAWPDPTGPMWVMELPIAASTGRARSTSASEPPTMIVSVPFWAPSEPPETGASTSATPRSARRSASSRVADGEIVEQSMTRPPCGAPAATPSSPNRTSVTSGVSETQMTTTSDSAASVRGSGDSSAPSETGSPARPGVRFQTRTSKPARQRLAAIAAPIVPMPQKPTRVGAVPFI